MQTPISLFRLDSHWTKLEFRLRLLIFRPIGRHGATTPGTHETQAAKSLSSAQEDSASRDPPRAGQTEGKEATRRSRVVWLARVRLSAMHSAETFGDGATFTLSDCRWAQHHFCVA
jgi:hypothetical protein